MVKFCYYSSLGTWGSWIYYWETWVVTFLPRQYSLINFLHFFNESTTWIPWPRLSPTGLRIQRFFPPSSNLDFCIIYFSFVMLLYDSQDLKMELCSFIFYAENLLSALWMRAKWDMGMTKSTMPLTVFLSLLLNYIMDCLPHLDSFISLLYI